MWYYCIIFLLSFSSLSLKAQFDNYSSWMESLPDDLYLHEVSIPGTHNSGTGEGLRLSIGFGVTQTLSIEEQWECGIRAFDLRLGLYDDVLHVCHSRLLTNITFLDFLSVICRKLYENPSEFAIVLLRDESNGNTSQEQYSWSLLVGNTLNAIANRASKFTQGLRVEDLRGKILFFSRNSYQGSFFGGKISGWNHSENGTRNAHIESYFDGSGAKLMLQDYYAPTNAEKRVKKIRAVKNFISLANNTPIDVLTFNFLSGYSTTWLGFTSIATTSGYKRNAEWIHPLVLADITEYRDVKSRKLGILFMDFAGLDKACGGVFHWSDFNIMGDKLVKAIIKSNFISAD